MKGVTFLLLQNLFLSQYVCAGVCARVCVCVYTIEVLEPLKLELQILGTEIESLQEQQTFPTTELSLQARSYLL